MKNVKNESVGQLPDGCMDTYSGIHFNFDKLDPETIDIVDIAHHLSLICRYLGACKFHYSVGQHSILVATITSRMGGSAITQLKALLHDASEAYLGDIIRPWKYHKGNENLVALDHQLLRVIDKKYGLEKADYQLVQDADNIMAATEAKQLIRSQGFGWKGLPKPIDIEIVPMEPAVIEGKFLALFNHFYSISHPKG